MVNDLSIGIQSHVVSKPSCDHYRRTIEFQKIEEEELYLIDILMKDQLV